MVTSDLSPELVLVSPPELAAAARAALPDRPWESCGSLDAPPLPRREQTGSRRELAAQVSAAEPEPEPSEPPAGRSDTGVLVLLLAALSQLDDQQAAVAATPVDVPVDGPAAAQVTAPVRLEAPIAAPQAATAPLATEANVRPSRRERHRVLAAKTVTAAVVLVSTLAAVTWASNRTIPPTLGEAETTLVPAPATPLGGAGFVFDGGRFRVAPDGHSLDAFELTTLCTGPVVFHAVPLHEAGTFGFTGTPEHGGGTATVDGQITGTTATIALRLDVVGCPKQPLTRSARIS